MTTTARTSEEEQTLKKPKLTQQNQQQEVDRISQLPDDILHPILSLLTLKEACITSALSKRWRNLFPTLPRLDFDDFSFCYSSVGENPPLDDEIDGDCWLESACDILESRRAPIRICTLHSQYFCVLHKYFDNIIYFLCNDGVQELTISNTGDHYYTVPSCLYFCRTLTCIEFRKCILKNLVFGSDKLAVLDVTTHRQLAVYIVSAPRLETVTLRFRYAQSEPYPLEGNDTDDSEVRMLVGLLESLRDVRNLSLEFDGTYVKNLNTEGVAIPVTLRSLLPKTKRVTLKMQPNKTCLVSIVSCLLNSCPNLEDLVFGDNYYFRHDEHEYRYVKVSMLDYWAQHAPSHCMTNTLCKVTLCLDFGYRWKYWIEPVKFLLSNACVLKSLVIDCHCSVRYCLEYLQIKLLLVQPASPDVVVELKTSRRQMFEVL